MHFESEIVMQVTGGVLLDYELKAVAGFATPALRLGGAPEVALAVISREVVRHSFGRAASSSPIAHG